MGPICPKPAPYSPLVCYLLTDARRIPRTARRHNGTYGTYGTYMTPQQAPYSPLVCYFLTNAKSYMSYMSYRSYALVLLAAARIRASATPGTRDRRRFVRRPPIRDR